MPIVEFRPSGKKVEAAPGTGLLDAARKAGLTIDVPCGEKGTCYKCLVRILAGSVDHEESAGLREELEKQGVPNSSASR